MVLPDGRNPGALDFQDAVLGPATYDLASLARDAYVVPDAARVAVERGGVVYGCGGG